MTTVELTLQIPDDVARRARAAGLLRAERIVELIVREVTVEHGTGANSDASSLDSLRPQNQQLLALLAAWVAEPDDRGDAWWDDFEAELAANRLVIDVRNGE
jgi:hypothetical protein